MFERLGEKSFQHNLHSPLARLQNLNLLTKERGTGREKNCVYLNIRGMFLGVEVIFFQDLFKRIYTNSNSEYIYQDQVSRCLATLNLDSILKKIKSYFGQIPNLQGTRFPDNFFNIMSRVFTMNIQKNGNWTTNPRSCRILGVLHFGAGHSGL